MTRGHASPGTTPVGKAWHAVKRAWAYVNGPGVVPFFLQLGLAFVLIKFVLFPTLGLLFGSSLPVVAVMSGSMEHRATEGQVCGVQAPDGYSGSFEEYWKTCGAWYEARNITQAEFSEFPLKRGFNKGDIMVIVGPDRGTIAVGDTIVYQAREAYPIIHRVVSVRETEAGVEYSTKGDFNGAQIELYIVSEASGRASACHIKGRPAACQEGERVTSATPGAIAILDETRIPDETLIGRAVFRIPLLGWVKIGAANAMNAVFGN